MSNFDDSYEGLEPPSLDEANETLGVRFAGDLDYITPPSTDEADSWLKKVRKPYFDTARVVSEAEASLNRRFSPKEAGNFKDVLETIIQQSRSQEAPNVWASLAIKAMNLQPRAQGM